MSKSDTFDKLRLVDRIDGAHISSGAAHLLGYVQRVQRAGRWHIATADALAAALKVSRRSIVRYLGELRDLGLLAIWKRKAVRDGARVNLASGYRIVVDALREAASDGFERRKAVIKAKLAALCGRSVKRSCAKLAQQTRQEDKQMLWNMLGQAVEGGPGWETLVAALIRAGEGQTEADFRGFGRA
jgi:predicted DNA-binding transcriptional regulator YafY